MTTQEEAKKKVSAILRKVVDLSDEYTLDGLFVRWGKVERDIHKLIEEPYERIDTLEAALARLVEAGEVAWQDLMAVHPRERMAHSLVSSARNGIRAAIDAAREVLDDHD